MTVRRHHGFEINTCLEPHMSPQSLPIGAHLATKRLGYVHHGVYAGGGRVIHAAGFKRYFRKGPVEEVSLEEFSAGRRWRIRSWPRNRAEGLARVERARSGLGEDAYRFWSSNCEHFVRWQALAVMALLFGVLLAGCAGAQPEPHAASLKPTAATERWWTHLGAAAALERRIALTRHFPEEHDHGHRHF